MWMHSTLYCSALASRPPPSVRSPAVSYEHDNSKGTIRIVRKFDIHIDGDNAPSWLTFQAQGHSVTKKWWFGTYFKCSFLTIFLKLNQEIWRGCPPPSNRTRTAPESQNGYADEYDDVLLGVLYDTYRFVEILSNFHAFPPELLLVSVVRTR